MGLCPECKGLGNTIEAYGGEVEWITLQCDNCGNSYKTIKGGE